MTRARTHAPRPALCPGGGRRALEGPASLCSWDGGWLLCCCKARLWPLLQPAGPSVLALPSGTLGLYLTAGDRIRCLLCDASPERDDWGLKIIRGLQGPVACFLTPGSPVPSCLRAAPPGELGGDPGRM